MTITKYELKKIKLLKDKEQQAKIVKDELEDTTYNFMSNKQIVKKLEDLGYIVIVTEASTEIREEFKSTATNRVSRQRIALSTAGNDFLARSR